MNIPRIAELLSYADDGYISEAVDFRPAKRRSLRGYAAIAACVAIALVSAGVFALTRSIRIEKREPLPSGTFTTATDGEEPMRGLSIPLPFGDDIGKDSESEELRGFFEPCVQKLDDIPEELLSLVPEEDYKSWAESLGEIWQTAPSSIEDYPNIYSFITRFGVADDEVRGAVTTMTEEELDTLLEGDVEKITLAFASEYSIVSGENVYSPYWVYVHEVEDYETVGLTPEEIENKLSYYASFKYNDMAREFFENKLNEFIVPLGDGVTLMYRDHTLIYNYDLPLVMKEFAVIDIEQDSSEVLYLIDNDPESGDKNIYAAVYMWDQLITVGRDSEKSFDAFEAFCSYAGRSDYYKSFTPVPRGTVVRLAWDGLYETAPDGEPRRLTWLSRLQFSDSDCAYSEEELEAFAEKLEGHYLDCEEFENFVFLNNPGPEIIGNGYELIGGTEPYKLVPNLSGERDELIATLDSIDFEPRRESYIYYYGVFDEGRRVDYEFYYLLDCYITPESMHAIQALSGYSFTPVWKTSGNYANHADGKGHMTERTTVYCLGDDYRLLCYDFPIEQENGDTLYAQVFRKDASPYDGLDPDGFEKLSDYYELLYRYARSSAAAYYRGKYYHCVPYHPSAEEIERFKAEGEYIGESVYKPSMPVEEMFDYNGPNALKYDEGPAMIGESDYDRLLRSLKAFAERSEYTSPGNKLFDLGEFEYYDYREDNSYDCFVGNLMPGVPLYRSGNYIMAIPYAPIYNGKLEPIAARLYYCGSESMELPSSTETEEYTERLEREYSETDGAHEIVSEKTGQRWELCETTPTRAEINEFRYYGNQIDYAWFDLESHWTSGSGRQFNIANALPDGERQERARCYACGDMLLLEFDEPKGGVYGRIYRLK